MPQSKKIKMSIDRSSDNLTLVLHGIKDIRLEQTPIPESLAPDEVLLETDSVGICGSDVHYWQNGRIGDFVLQKPMILGHETSAVVREVGTAVRHLCIGQRVAVEPGQACSQCDYCKRGRYNLCLSMKFHATPPYDGSLRRYFSHPAHLCFALPDQVDSESGACVEPLSVGVHACNRARVACGHRVLICGAGPIGLVSLLVAKAYGASSICITDINEKRLQLAKQLGATTTILISAQETDQQVADRAVQSLGIDGFDRTIECSGVESSLRTGILATKASGVLAMVGMGPLEVKVPLVTAAIREIDILGVFRYANCYPQAIDLLATNKVDVRPLVTHRFALEDSINAFEAAHSGEAIKAIIKCQKSD